MVAIAANRPICYLLPARKRTHDNSFDPSTVRSVDHMRLALSSRGLTLYQVSCRSAEIFGRSSPYYVPQRLYNELTTGGNGPSIHQLAAISSISRYRLRDWMAIFGFRLDDIPKFQSIIPWPNTVVLDSSVYDDERRIPWFTEREPPPSLPRIVPLAHILRPAPPTRVKDLLTHNEQRFLYAKIGQNDPFALPVLTPGSIVRIDIRRSSDFQTRSAGCGNEIFLVEIGTSLYCGRLRPTDGEKILLYSQEFPFMQIELSEAQGLRIVGPVDTELRVFQFLGRPRIRQTTPSPHNGVVLLPTESHGALRNLLRTSRLRVGISFREASDLSRWIARTVGDPLYFSSPGTLSDYEKSNSPPFHVQKVLLLCILYCVNFWTLLRVAGLSVDSLGTDPMPNAILSDTEQDSRRDLSDRKRNIECDSTPLPLFDNRWEEVPVFLADSLPGILGITNFSLTNVFWIGTNTETIHPALAGASLLAINPRARKPPQKTAPIIWQELLYLILLRDGTYLCGPCVLRGEILMIHPYSQTFRRSVRLRNRIDCEVIGQVTGALRRLC